jgi:hypothetical protein
MAEFAIEIKATVQARNLASADKKLAALKERIARYVEWSEIQLVGVPEKEKDADE